MKEKPPKELYFNSYEVDTHLTIPLEEELTIKVIDVMGVSENGERTELTKIAEKDLALEDYLDLENRLVKLLFITLTDIFHTSPKLKKHVYRVPAKVKEIVEVIEVKKRDQREKTTKYKLTYDVGITINLVKVTEV